jgi:hypothetical protein
MAANSTTAQNASLNAQALVMKWYADFLAQWTKPQIVQMVQGAWAQMPAEMKDQLKAENPDAYNKIVNLLGQQNQAGG